MHKSSKSRDCYYGNHYIVTMVTTSRYIVTMVTTIVTMVTTLRLDCCGLDGPEDWGSATKAAWWANRYNDGTVEVTLPGSCCIAPSASTCQVYGTLHLTEYNLSILLQLCTFSQQLNFLIPRPRTVLRCFTTFYTIVCSRFYYNILFIIKKILNP